MEQRRILLMCLNILFLSSFTTNTHPPTPEKKKKKEHQKGKKPKQKKKEAKWKTVIIEVKQPVRVVQSWKATKVVNEGGGLGGETKSKWGDEGQRGH